MTTEQPQIQSSPLTPADEEAVRHLKEAIASGKQWYIALLEAIGRWHSTEESLNGQTYHYLISGEAFDWLTLSERLLMTVSSLVPQDEKIALLFHSQPPLELPAGKFKELIGSSKYHQYLNYFYGITAEEALALAVEDEVRKERQALGLNKEYDTSDEAYRRIYGTTQHELLKHFRKERGNRQSRSIGLSELKEFTYWCFKYRLKHCDKARVASDTKKALGWLKENAHLVAK